MEPHPSHEAKLAAIDAFLRAELGFGDDGPGGLRRQIEENTVMIRTMDAVLRGQGGELGVIGWLTVIRRTWIALVALLGAAFGYFMNDVVDTISGHQTGMSHAVGWDDG